MLTTHTVTIPGASIEDLEHLERSAVAYVVAKQGVVDSVQTSSAYRPDGKIDFTISIDYEPGVPN